MMKKDISYIALFAIIILLIVPTIIVSQFERDKQTTNETPQINEKHEEEYITDLNEMDFSLSEIIKNEIFIKGYSVSKNIDGNKFIFKCTSFIEKENECNFGYGYLKTQNFETDLYNFTNSKDNYIKKPDKLYIQSTKDKFMVFLGSENIIKIIDVNTKKENIIENVISGYEYEEKYYDFIYPKMLGSSIEYITCDDNTVVVKKQSVFDNSSTIEVEKIENATCK